MAHDQFTKQICVGLIIFGTATEESFTIIGQLAGINRIEHEELICHQLVNERSSTLFKADKHFTFGAEAFMHLSNPIV
jgi:hypothetical protein